MQLPLHARWESFTDPHAAGPQHIAAIQATADSLNSHTDIFFAVVYRPECRLLAPILRDFPVMDAKCTESRKIEYGGLDNRTTVNKAKRWLEISNPCNNARVVKVGDEAYARPDSAKGVTAADGRERTFDCTA